MKHKGLRSHRVNHGRKKSCPVLEVNERYHIYIHSNEQNILNELILTTTFGIVAGKSKARPNLKHRNDPRDAHSTTAPVTQTARYILSKTTVKNLTK